MSDLRPIPQRWPRGCEARRRTCTDGPTVRPTDTLNTSIPTRSCSTARAGRSTSPSPTAVTSRSKPAIGSCFRLTRDIRRSSAPRAARASKGSCQGPRLDALPMRPLTPRMSRLGTETAFEVLAKARALEAKGRDIVHLEIGEPDFDTPPSVVSAGVAALERGETHYTPSAGVVELRDAIAAYLGARRGLSVDPTQVVVTPGAKPIMFYALLALLDAGDEAIYPDPGFPIYASMIDFAGARGVALPLREANAFQPDLDELRELVTERTKLIILNSPHNPTGGVLGEDAIREIASIARERDLWVLSDEIYGELVYEGRHRSIALEQGLAERTILLDGFRKTFEKTGWRLGYGVFPRYLAEPVTKLVTNSVSCSATFVQRAG